MLARKNGGVREQSDAGAGLFRTVLGGQGATLQDAFTIMERTADGSMLCRHPVRPLVAARLALSPQEGEGYLQVTRIGNDIYVIECNFAYRDPRVELIPGDGLLQFYFKLSGDLTLGVSRTEPLRLNRPSLLVYNQPTGVDVHEWTTPSAMERAVAVVVSGRFLAEHFLAGRSASQTQLQALADGEPGKFKYVQLPITAEMFDLATKLIENPGLDALRLVRTEAIALELLCAAVAGFDSLAQRPHQEYGERDLRGLNAARALLMKQFTPAPTIRQVARAAGMNETALKLGFKAVFGETVFEFSVRCRMQYAVTLLRERQLPVSRVAEAVGYAHQTSFATAFRRHFGVPPHQMRPPRSRPAD